MSFLTAVLYGALIAYLGGWYFGHWSGNFSLLLFVLTMVTLGYWLAEHWRFKPAREAAARSLETQDAHRRAELRARASRRSTATFPRPSSAC